MDHTQYTPNPRKKKRLTLKERVKIEIMSGEGHGIYSIAKALNRPINTIINGLRRGTVEQIKNGKKIKKYYRDTGQTKYEANRKRTGRR